MQPHLSACNTEKIWILFWGKFPLCFPFRKPVEKFNSQSLENESLNFSVLNELPHKFVLRLDSSLLALAIQSYSPQNVEAKKFFTLSNWKIKNKNEFLTRTRINLHIISRRRTSVQICTVGDYRHSSWLNWNIITDS